MSILAHMILIMPHPFTFENAAPPEKTPTAQQQPGRRPAPFSPAGLRTRLFYRPLASLSETLAPTSRVYRGLTPQFKTFLQIAAMTFGGCVWAEHRVTDYLEKMRKLKRAERASYGRSVFD